MGIATCPRPSDLEQLFLGGLTEADAEVLEQHVLECSSCLEKLKTLLQSRDTLATSLGGDTCHDADGASPVIDTLLKKLEGLRPASVRAPLREEATIVIACPACKKNWKVKGELAGKKIKCPGCAQVLALPISGRTTEAAQQTFAPTPDPSTEAPTHPDLTKQPTNPPPRASDNTVDLQPGTRASTPDSSLTDFLAPPQAGDELGRLGHYRILQILGHGGMGVVYKAEDPKLKRLVAIKAMLPTLAASASCGQRFKLEAEAMAKVEHDNIVRIYEINEDRGIFYMAMEFLKGQPLDERLKHGPPLPMDEVVRIGREIARALGAAHSTGLIHRDIKPGNIWLEAPESRVKILDFGLARVTSQDSGLTQQGAVVGTPAYMSPEQARGAVVDARSDLFSLGTVLYRMCTGKQPFVGADTVSTLMAVATTVPPAPSAINAEVPEELSELVMKLLEKDLDRRIGTAAEVVQALTDLQKQMATDGKTDARLAQKKIPKLADKASADTVALDAKRIARTSAVGSRHPVAVAVVAVAALFFCAIVSAGVIGYQLLFQTNNGTLVVEADGEADVRFQKGELRIHDEKGNLLYKLKPSEKNKSLPVGKYQMEVWGVDGLKLDTTAFEMTKKGQTVRVTVRPPDLAKKVPDPKDKTSPEADPSKIELIRRIPVAAVRNLFYDNAVSNGGKYALVTRDVAPGVNCDVYLVATGERIFDCVGYRAAFLGDGEEVVVDGENKFRVYESKSGKLLREGAHGDFYSFRTAPGGKYLVYWGAKFYALFDLTTMKEMKKWDYQSPGPANFAGFSFSSDARRLFLSLGKNEPWTVWDVEKNAPAEGAKHLTGVTAIHWQFPDGKTAAVERGEKLPRLNWETGEVVEELTGLDAPPGALQGIYSLDGRCFITRYPDGKLLQYRVPFDSVLVSQFQLPADDCAVPVPGSAHATQSISEDHRYATLLTPKNLYVLRLPALAPPAKKESRNAVAEKGVLDFAEIHDADEKRFDAWIARMKKDDFRPVRVTVQMVKETPRYTAVALKEDKKWPWEFSRCDADEEGHNEKRWDRKFEIVAHAVFRNKGKIHEVFFWAKDNSLNNDTVRIGDATDIGNRVKAAKKKKLRLLSRSAVFLGNEPEFAIVVDAPDGVPWIESYDLSLDAMKEWVEKNQADGWRPDHLYYYGVGAKRLFGAILIKDASQAEREMDWGLTPADYERELIARKARGFRPLTTIGHEDHTGAQRFSVVWIRYRPATRE